MNDHFRPGGKPGPPRPRRADFFSPPSADGRAFAAGGRVEYRFQPPRVQVLEEVVVDLHDRRVHAGAETFDLDEREQAVRAALAHPDAELSPAGLRQLLGPAAPPRCGAAA